MGFCAGVECYISMHDGMVIRDDETIVYCPFIRIHIETKPGLAYDMCGLSRAYFF